MINRDAGPQARPLLSCAIICFAGTSLASLPLAAEPDEKSIEISGQLRVREEIKHELFTPADPMGVDTGDEAHLRARVRVDATVSEQLAIVVELQDVRNFGSEGSTVADTEGVDLKRGYVTVTPKATDLTVTIGRWVMAYGDQRLIGHLEWVDQGRSYDGVHASYKPGKTSVDAFAVRVRETLGADDDLHFAGVYSQIALVPGLQLDLYALGLRDAMAPNQTFATLGYRAALKRGPLDGTAEAAVQVGESGGNDLVALMGVANVGYTFPEAGLRLAGEIAYASGDDDPADDSDNTFRTLFPTNHLHYGYADLAALQNLLAFRARLSAKPSPTVITSVDLHHLRLANTTAGWFNAGGRLLRPGAEDVSSTLGNEIDVVVRWKAMRGLSVEAGVALFISGGFVEETGDADNPLFGYAQVVAKF